MAKPQVIEEGEVAEPARVSRLQSDLAAKILRMLKEQGVGPGYHLVELDLCRQFDVSRTPVRGALRLLEERGMVEGRTNRGYVLKTPIVEAPEFDPPSAQFEEDQNLFVAIARARNEGRLPDQCTQQELVRQFDVKLATAVRVLRQLADLGLAERKPGNGWSFNRGIDTPRARQDSYAFRSIIEPAGLLESTFEVDTDWLERSRASHLAFRRRRWKDTLAFEFYEINADFHEQLARCSGNRYIHGAVQQQNRLRSFLNYQWVNGPERVISSIDEHVAILDAVGASDNKRAHLLMKLHLGNAESSRSTIG
jgi:DNA-binding GntR family transcriptional regulator